MQWVLDHIPYGLLLAGLFAIMKAAYSRLTEHFKFDPALWAANKLKHAIRFKRQRRAAEAIRWLIIGAVLGGLLIIYSGVSAAFWWFGPRPGKETVQLVDVIGGNFAIHEPTPDDPVMGTLAYRAKEGHELKRMCARGHIFGHTTPFNDAEEAEQMERVARLTAAEFEVDIGKCGTLKNDPYKFSSFYPLGTWPASSIDDIKAGRKYGYIFAAFAYKESDDSPLIVQTECRYFFESTETMHDCSGDTSRAFYAGKP